MIGVLRWWTHGGKEGSHHNHNCAAPNNKRSSSKFVWIMWNLVPSAAFMVLLTVTLMTANANAQLFRRPAVSPQMEAYRNRWMAYLKSRSTTSTTRAPLVGVRGGNDGNGLVINGFQCDRTYSFFPSRENPRMYHLCARSRDSWYVYHYFCPNGSLFHDGMGKCMQDRVSSGNANSGNNNLGNIRRPTSNAVPRRTTVAPPPVLHRTTIPTITTTSTTEGTTSSSSTTTEEPEPVPEPDSDHVGVTEDQNVAISSSSEEGSTEDAKEIDMMVSVPGLTMTSEQQQSSDEQIAEEQPAAHENEASDEGNMIIPESANGSSRLVVTTTTPLPSSTTKQKSQTPLKRIPLKGMKHTASIHANEDDESGNSSTTALGDRRPRMLKKMKYWRDFLVGKQPY